MSEDNKLIVKDGKYRVEAKKNKACFFMLLEEFLHNPYGNIVNCKWICFLLIFSSLFLFSWTLFALLWYLLAYRHGDLEIHGDNFDTQNDKSSIRRPCVLGLKNFADSLFFSIDLQSTLGYGRSEIQDECPAAVALFFAQSFVGILVQATAVALVFTKFSNISSGNRANKQNLVYPQRLILVKVDKGFEHESQNAFKTHYGVVQNCGEIKEKFQPSLKKYLKNPNTPAFVKAPKSGKFKIRNLDKLKIDGFVDYIILFQFQNPSGLSFLDVCGFLVLKKVSADSRQTVSIEINSVKSIKLSDETVDAKTSMYDDKGPKYTHHVDRKSPLRPYLLSIIKSRPKGKTIESCAYQTGKLKHARSLENFKIETNTNLQDFKRHGPFKNVLSEFVAHHSHDDAYNENDTQAAVVKSKLTTTGKSKLSQKLDNLAKSFENIPIEVKEERSFNQVDESLKSCSRISELKSTPGSDSESITSSQSSAPSDVSLSIEEVKTNVRFEVELVFFINGTDTKSGKVIEDKTSYLLDDIVSDI